MSMPGFDEVLQEVQAQIMAWAAVGMWAQGREPAKELTIAARNNGGASKVPHLQRWEK